VGACDVRLTINKRQRFVDKNGGMNAGKVVGRLVRINHRKHRERAKENSFCAWLRQYCNNLKGFPVHKTSEQRLERFLSAFAENVMSSRTLNQAFNTVIFPCEEVLGAEPGSSGRCGRVEKQPKKEDSGWTVFVQPRRYDGRDGA